jgi:hypothetical protein
MSLHTTAPAPAATWERCHSIVNEGMWPVALQCRRLRGHEPEDDNFIFRWWADLQFLIVALTRLRRAALILTHGRDASPSVKDAVKAFDKRLPGLRRMRNIGEHIDAYTLDKQDRHDKSVYRQDLQVGHWDGKVFSWLGQELDVHEALAASEDVFRAVKAAMPAVMRSVSHLP